MNKTQVSKKLAHLVPMLPRGNTYLPRVTARYAFPPNTLGTRKLWFVQRHEIQCNTKLLEFSVAYYILKSVFKQTDCNRGS